MNKYMQFNIDYCGVLIHCLKTFGVGSLLLDPAFVNSLVFPPSFPNLNVKKGWGPKILNTETRKGTTYRNKVGGFKKKKHEGGQRVWV